jgi:hypothetical protein
VETVITISGADKSGASARILTFLARKGYGLKGYQIMEAPSGSRQLMLRFDPATLDQARLAAEIKSLDGAFSVVQSAQTASDPLKAMAAGFPDIAGLVQAYGASFTAEMRDQALFDAGRKIGGFNYAKDWSLGNPLRMPQALRRALVPALAKMGEVEGTDAHITLLDSRFCATGAQIHCCEFLGGFMHGFLDAGPATKGTRVQKVGCVAAGAQHCRYSIIY